MKRLSYILIFISAIILFLPIHTYAQVASYCTGSSSTEGNPLCYNSDGTVKASGSCPDGYVPLADASQGCRDANSPDTTVSSAQSSKVTEPPACFTWTNGLNINECFKGLFENISYLILKLMGFVLYLAGVFLNKVIEFTIVNFKTNISNLTGINIAWKAIKDLMNIAFIFILIYEAILVILSIGSVGNIRKFVTGIVLAAILINFSLFFTKILIDTSNIVTIGFYNVIVGPNAAAKNIGLSDPIMTQLGLTQIYDSKTPDLFGQGKDLGGIGIMALGSAVLILVAAFVFFAVSILFIVRYIVLIILLMLSPIAYMGMALDFMKSYSKDWWSAFRSQLIFAPVYMIMTWAILTVMSQPGFITGNIQDMYKGGESGYAAMGLLLNFAVIIGLVIGSLVLAKNTSTSGSKYIANLTGQATTLAGNALFGTGARLGRNTIGRFGAKLSENENLKDTASRGGIRGLGARTLLRTGSGVATSTFDARVAPGAESLIKQSGLNFGKVDTKNQTFKAESEERSKREADFAKTLKPSDDEMDKIKQRTGHSDLENDEKAAKKNQDSSIKIAEELIEKEDEIKGQLEKMEKGQVTATKEEIDILKDQLRSTQERRQLEANKQAQLKASVEATSKKVKASQEELDKIYKKRVESFAQSFENDQFSRYAKNVLKVLGGGAFGAGFVTTKADSKETARKIRSVIKEKKKPTAKAIKELFDVDVEIEEEEKAPEPAVAEQPTQEEKK